MRQPNIVTTTAQTISSDIERLAGIVAKQLPTADAPDSTSLSRPAFDAQVMRAHQTAQGGNLTPMIGILNAAPHDAYDSLNRQNILPDQYRIGKPKPSVGTPDANPSE